MVENGFRETRLYRFVFVSWSWHLSCDGNQALTWWKSVLSWAMVVFNFLPLSYSPPQSHCFVHLLLLVPNVTLQNEFILNASLCRGEYPCQVSRNFINNRSLRQHLFALCKHLVNKIVIDCRQGERSWEGTGGEAMHCNLHCLSCDTLAAVVVVGYNTIQYNTIQYNTIQYNTIQYNTIQV